MAGPCGFASVVLALTLFGIQFGIIALIGMTLPIGVATKNAILMTNSAPRAQRDDGTEPREAIFVSLRRGPPFQNRAKRDATQLSRLYERG